MKAFRLFTGHPAQASALPADLRKALPPKEKSNLYYRELSDEIRRELWNRFRSGLEPLRRSGKLGVVLLQFAPWFVFGRESFAHILHCAQMLAGLPLAVEFRNKSWFGEKTRDKALAFEREHSLAHVAVDEGAMWAKKGLASAAERFDYLYSTAELKALGQPVKDLASKARRVHVLFNNCHGDKAQRNAAQFRQLIA